MAGERGSGGTYRRRRATIAIVVAVTALVGIRLSGAGAGEPAAGPAAGPANTIGPARSASAAPRPRARATAPSPKPSGSPSPAASSAPSASAVGCGPDGLRLGALTAVGDAYSTLIAGSPTRFRLAVRSTAAMSCPVRPDITLTVTSGSDRIWTTRDCPLLALGVPTPSPTATPTPSRPATAQGVLWPASVLLAPGASTTLNIVWPGVRSVGTCTRYPAALRPGTYVAEVIYPGVGSTRTAFQLS